MIAKLLRVLLGLFLLPACFAFAKVFYLVLMHSSGVFSEMLFLLGGIAAFLLCWFLLPRPVKMYVLGHELTHALSGMLFGAKASKFTVTDKGGSVNLTKTNFIITLAPYFFPFYTFVVGIAALIVLIFVRPLPLIPLWVALVGFTWAFHLLFTLDSLSQRQPDILTYGKMLSWTFIFLANISVVLLWFSAVSSVTLSFVMSALYGALMDSYVWVGEAISALCNLIVESLRGEL